MSRVPEMTKGVNVERRRGQRTEPCCTPTFSGRTRREEPVKEMGKQLQGGRRRPGWEWCPGSQGKQALYLCWIRLRVAEEAGNCLLELHHGAYHWPWQGQAPWSRFKREKEVRKWKWELQVIPSKSCAVNGEQVIRQELEEDMGQGWNDVTTHL